MSDQWPQERQGGPTANRTLPPGDYAYLVKSDRVLPCVVVGKRGRWHTTVLAFEPFRGTTRRRVRTRHLVEIEEANRLHAFRNDPMAVLHMVGEDGSA
jgi:hypothetical protein